MFVYNFLALWLFGDGGGAFLFGMQGGGVTLSSSRIQSVLGGEPNSEGFRTPFISRNQPVSVTEAQVGVTGAPLWSLARGPSVQSSSDGPRLDPAPRIRACRLQKSSKGGTVGACGLGSRRKATFSSN